MILELPWPPTINTYWRHVVMGKRSIVLLSAKGREYRRLVEDYVREARLEGVPLTGRLRVMMLLHCPTRQKYDIDNRPKGVLDGLQRAGVFKDDEQIDHLEVIRGDVQEDGRVLVNIEVMRRLNYGVDDD